MNANIIPNAFQSPNVYIDVAMQYLNESEFKILMFTTRHILGWGQERIAGQRPISLTMFENGFETSKGYVCGGVGLSRGTIIKAVNSLVEFGLLKKEGEPGNDGQAYSLCEQFEIDKLKQRHADRQKSRKKQTVKATKASVKKRAEIIQFPDENEGGNVERTSNVERTTGGNVERTTTSNVERTQSKTIKTNKEKDFVPPAQDPEPDPPKPKPDFDWKGIVNAVNVSIGIYGAEQNHIANMLLGRSKKEPYCDHNLPDPATPDEITRFGTWMKRKYPDISIRKPATIESYFLQFRAEKAQPEPQVFVYTPPDPSIALTKWMPEPPEGKSA